MAEGKLDKYGKPNEKTPSEWLNSYKDLASSTTAEAGTYRCYRSPLPSHVAVAASAAADLAASAPSTPAPAKRKHDSDDESTTETPKAEKESKRSKDDDKEKKKKKKKSSDPEVCCCRPCVVLCLTRAVDAIL